ncbi:MAG: carboxypeptidase-like regulatory domain-containing protein [Candidatus Poseidoniaceae archaeon]|nr:carboxypeptidase-like regulatory domain-containing protein [Candidatus Poseidoniaceae archaeon]
MSEKSFDERREALKARVKKQLEDSTTQTSEPELVVSETELVVEDIGFDGILELEYDDKARIRKIASVLILVGSLLGIFSGGIILQGNPSELLNSSLFEQTQSVDITGQTLDIEGESLYNVRIELVDYDSSETLQTTYTNENGYFQLKDVKAETMLLRVSLEGYNTIERTFDAVDGIMQPFTMKNGSEVTKEFRQSEDSGWSLEAAVGLSTFIGVMTIITGIVGIQASVETRRAKRYRRTQYLAGISLFSRGLILFGPILILAGMGLLALSKEQFEDTKEV